MSEALEKKQNKKFSSSKVNVGTVSFKISTLIQTDILSLAPFTRYCVLLVNSFSAGRVLCSTHLFACGVWPLNSGLQNLEWRIERDIDRRYHMLQTIVWYPEPFQRNSRVWQTDRQTDRHSFGKCPLHVARPKPVSVGSRKKNLGKNSTRTVILSLD